MPRGSKTKYSAKQKRMARHIEAGYETRGVSEGEAERRAWATVNADTGGGERGGSGSRGGRVGGAARGGRKRAGSQTQAGSKTRAAAGRKRAGSSRSSAAKRGR